MNISFRVRVIHHVNHRYGIRLKFGDQLTSLTKLVLEAKANIFTSLQSRKIYFHILLLS